MESLLARNQRKLSEFSQTTKGAKESERNSLSLRSKFAEKPTEPQSFNHRLSLFSPSKLIIVGFFNPFPLPFESIDYPFLFLLFSFPISFFLSFSRTPFVCFLHLFLLHFPFTSSSNWVLFC